MEPKAKMFDPGATVWTNRTHDGNPAHLNERRGPFARNRHTPLNPQGIRRNKANT
jgi:hypothetical protein